MISVENITDKGDTGEWYSVIDNMDVYRVNVVKPDEYRTEYTVDDSEGKPITDIEIHSKVVEQVFEFRKEEK